MSKRKIPDEKIRQYLLTFAICLSYVVFIVFGIFLVKYFPPVVNYLDWSIIPIGLSCVVFIYLFALTYEKRINIRLSNKTLETARLYGAGLSFKEIQEKLDLSNISDVKRRLTEFCKSKGE